MNTLSRWSVMLALLSGAAYGQVPSTNDTSDANFNTGMGTGALSGPAPENRGANNTAAGAGALYSNNTGGDGNSATGYDVLYSNSTGSGNTASGAYALFKNSSGNQNTVAGGTAMYSNTTGDNNSALGVAALRFNTTGSNNVAVGIAALEENTTGSYNIAIGTNAGDDIATGNNNIDIGSPGAAKDSGAIRIGTAGNQKETFIAGIYDTSVKGNSVVVNSSGQLGVVVSSERFKTDIEPMGSNTRKLQELRPVKFKLKSDAAGTTQYGLIAEQVAKVYPELVIRDEKGRIDGVRYDELAPMLLNELQQAQKKIASQDRKIRAMEQQVAELNDLKQEMRATLLKLLTRDQLVAER